MSESSSRSSNGERPVGESHVDRRSFLKKAGIVAGATAWTAPAMQMVRIPAGAQTTGSVVDPPPSTVACTPAEVRFVDPAENPCTPDGFGDKCDVEGAIMVNGSESFTFVSLGSRQNPPRWEVSTPGKVETFNGESCEYAVLDVKAVVSLGNIEETMSFAPDGSGGLVAPVTMFDEGDLPSLYVKYLLIDVCHPRCDPE